MLHKMLLPATGNKTEKTLKIIIAVLCLFYLCISIIFKPIVASDALSGMLSLHNYLNGGGWNKTVALSNNLSHITTSELTWWAQGQYVLPYFVSKALFVNIGTAIIILVFAAILGGCYFYYKIFRLSDISKSIMLCALLILLLERFINIYFIQYYSSDIFLFFYTPFYIFTYYLLLQNYQHKTILKVVLLTLLNAGGLFIKNSFILFELAANGFLVIEYFLNSKIADKESRLNTGDIAWWKKLSIPLPFVLANLANYYFFLRLGNNPTNGQGFSITLYSVLTGIFMPAVQTLFSSLSLNSLYGNFYEKIKLSGAITNALMLVILLIIAFIIYNKRAILYNLFKTNIIFRFVVVVCIINLLIWFTFTIKQSYISNEDRLYLPVSMLVLPFLLSFAVRSRSVIKYVYFVAIGCSVLYGMYSFVNRVKQYAINGSVWSKNKNLSGFKVLSTHKNDAPNLKEVTNIISTNYSNAYIVIANTSLAFELNVTNKFVTMLVLPVRGADNHEPSPNYIVLVAVGQDKPPVGLKKVYSSAKWEIYKPD